MWLQHLLLPYFLCLSSVYGVWGVESCRGCEGNTTWGHCANSPFQPRARFVPVAANSFRSYATAKPGASAHLQIIECTN